MDLRRVRYTYFKMDPIVLFQEGDVLPGKYVMVTCVDMHEALDGTFGGPRGVGVRLQEIRELELIA